MYIFINMYKYIYTYIYTSYIHIYFHIDDMAAEIRGGLKKLTENTRALSFDSSQLYDYHENLLFPEPVSAIKVSPLILHPGCLMVTTTRVYFQYGSLNNMGDSVQHFSVKNIVNIHSRRYAMKQTGIEIFFTSESEKESSVYYVFGSQNIRDYIVNMIKELPIYPKNKYENIDEIRGKWSRKEITNLDYLLYLNSEGDRYGNVYMCLYMCI
jgi:hypothetical protein